MAARVVWLVANRLVAPDGVLGLTFTRKAAAELGQRIRRRLAQWRHVVERDQSRRPRAPRRPARRRADRAHLRRLRRPLVAEHALRIGAEPDARLISPARRLAAGRRGVAAPPATSCPPTSARRRRVPRYVLAMSGQFADHLVDPERRRAATAATSSTWFEPLPLGSGHPLRVRPGDDREAASRSTRAPRSRCCRWSRRSPRPRRALPAVDFADQMTLAGRAGRGCPRCSRSSASGSRPSCSTSTRTPVTLRSRRCAACSATGHPVTAVGDPFQSIYGWRGASAGNIGRFAATFRTSDGTPATVFPLATSFRNDRVVLDAANAVAAPLRSGGTTVAAAAAPTPPARARSRSRALAHGRGRGPLGGRPSCARPGTRCPAASAPPPCWCAAARRSRCSPRRCRPRGCRSRSSASAACSPRPRSSTSSRRCACSSATTSARRSPGCSPAPAGASARAISRRCAIAPAGWLARPTPLSRRRAVPRPLSLVEALDDLGPPERYSAEGYRAARRSCPRSCAGCAAASPRRCPSWSPTSSAPSASTSRSPRVPTARTSDARTSTASSTSRPTSPTRPTRRRSPRSSPSSRRPRTRRTASRPARSSSTPSGCRCSPCTARRVSSGTSSRCPAWSTRCSRPSRRRSNWTRARHELPGPAARRPRRPARASTCAGAADRKEVRDRSSTHHDALVDRHADRGAPPRLRRVHPGAHRRCSRPATSGTPTQKPREPSPFLLELPRRSATESSGPSPSRTRPTR